MKKKQGVSDSKKRPIGRPRVGSTLIAVRLPPDQLAALDAWMTRHKMDDVSRAEAIRRLIERGMTNGAGAAPTPSRRKPAGKPAALRGAKLAARAKAAAAKRPARRQA